jgi:hypothetical protein
VEDGILSTIEHSNIIKATNAIAYNLLVIEANVDWKVKDPGDIISAVCGGEWLIAVADDGGVITCPWT